MVTQNDVDHLREELEQLRETVIRDRDSIEGRVNTIIARAKSMESSAQEENSPFEPAINSILSLLICFRSGIQAQNELNRARSA